MIDDPPVSRAAVVMQTSYPSPTHLDRRGTKRKGLADMNESVKLHGYYRSSASFRVRIALNLKGVAYEDAFHHLRRGEQRDPAYLELNRQGLVPTLEIDGKVLVQSLSILDYLDETRPEPPLLPADPAGRARVRALAQIVACDIHPIDNLRVLNYLRKTLHQPEDAIRNWYNAWIVDGFDAIEAMLASSAETGRFCHGDNITLADICLIPQVVNARNFDLDLAPFPTLRRIYEAATENPAFVKAMPSNQKDFE
jgi:maleylacetoacetate isomerase